MAKTGRRSTKSGKRIIRVEIAPERQRPELLAERRSVLKGFPTAEFQRVASEFDKDYFIQQYSSLVDPNETDFDSVFVQYLLRVAELKLDPNSDFSESGYLQRNPDVAAAVGGGSTICGFHHWLKYGRYEGRKGGDKIHRQAKPPKKSLLELDRPSNLAHLTAREIATILMDSGAVSPDDYLKRYPDLANSGVHPILHYVEWGHKEERIIHDLFDFEHYTSKYPDVAASGIFPLIEYLFEGAKKGRQPHRLYDLNDYVRRYNIDLNSSNPLIHYNLNKGKGVTVNTPYFDEKFYRETYPEVSGHPDGPLHHFIHHGVFEGRRPNPDFNPRYYYARHLNNDFSKNAFLHYLEYGADAGLETDQPKHLPTITREVSFFANPGPSFEELNVNLAKGRQKRAKLLAFYLPQFHAFAENDEWWGKGFTEWRNIPRGMPRFAGHYQPRIPRDLSFYDLTDPNVMKRQVRMAREMGLHGFCFYYYWFDRHRLMERPLDQFVADESIKMPFMLLWANENWTRRWDGMEAEVLIKQHHREGDDVALVDSFQSYFSDERYIRIEGRPFLVIYRADIIPDTARTLDKWRKIFRERHNENPLIFLAQTFLAEDPCKYGFDGAIEFPPHKLGNMVRPINDRIHYLDWDYTGTVFDYESAIKASLSEKAPEFPLVKTIFPSWDNNARRQASGTVYHGATPALFGDWLDGAIQYSQDHPVGGENIVFLNAWNEWCEGAYLEPDIHFGGAMLNAVARTVSSGNPLLAGEKFKLLLIGHDAFPAGAQINLLEMAKALQNRFGVKVHVILLGNGDLLSAYQAAVPTTVCDEADVAAKLEEFYASGFKFALANTTRSASLAGVLQLFGYKVVSLVHELPHLVKTNGLTYCADILRENSDSVVFASEYVRDAFIEAFGNISGNVVIHPQGIYKTFEKTAEYRVDIRRSLGIPPDAKIVINVAYGDLRKGIDLFCQAAQFASQTDSDLHFVWVGAVHPWAEEWILPDLKRRSLTNVHFVGNQRNIDQWMNAADVFFLTSREDPFPSVVLEAMQVGLPVVAYEGNGGFADLIGSDPKLGCLVPQGDVNATRQALVSQLLTGDDQEYRIEKARTQFNFADYLFELLKLFDPNLRKVSVAVTNYNYEQYIRGRINSIFEQTYPIYETIILDDNSSDDSLNEMKSTLDDSGRIARLVSSEQNSGNVFRQWEKALKLAKGELLWIAEADDLAEPTLVEKLAGQHAQVEDCIFAFCDSASIDENGNRVYSSYVPYAESIAPGVLDETKTLSTKEFAQKALGVANLVLNVSSVVWNKGALERSFARAAGDLASVKLVGDWMLYLAACEEKGNIAYDVMPMNIHRRHSSSVTHAMATDRHLSEISQMHDRVAMLLGDDAPADAQAEYLGKAGEWLSKNKEAAE